MQTKIRPLFARFTDGERKEFDEYCLSMGVNYSVMFRAMIKDCLARVKAGEKIDLSVGVSKYEHSPKSNNIKSE